MVFSQILKILFFFLPQKKNIGQKKLFCKRVDRKLPILDYINKELRKLKTLHFLKGFVHGFWSKIKKLCPFFFFSKKGQKKVFCSLLYRKPAILEYKNIHLEKSKICIFLKELVHAFWSKMANFLLFSFSAK